jgi:predicted KAP-like P-loop ATPase
MFHATNIGLIISVSLFFPLHTRTNTLRTSNDLLAKIARMISIIAHGKERKHESVMKIIR